MRLLLIIASLILMGILYWVLNPTNKAGLIANYESKQQEILEAKRYLQEIIPEDSYIDVEFGSFNRIEIFHTRAGSNWDIDLNSDKAKELLAQVGCTKSQLKELKRKLKKANCISISSGEPTMIGWKRAVMARYSYRIFNRNLNDSLISHYTDGCTSVFYKDNIVLMYESGAIGSLCFPKDR